MSSTQPTASKRHPVAKSGRAESRKLPKSTKAPRSTEEQLRRYFASLCAQIEGGFFKNAIKSCDRILRLVPNDADALQTKVFLLLQTDQYGSALEMLEMLPGGSSSSHQQPSNQFERAYVLYRLHREQEAQELVAANAADQASYRGIQHLDAQLKFRNNDYPAARNIYNELLDTCPPDTDEYQDILVNLEATQAHIDFLEKDYLKGVHALPKTQSASALEALPTPSIVSALSSVTNIPSGTTAPPSKILEPRAVKAPRKSRIPKHVVPGVTPPPDPERWLKKRERASTHRHNGRRKGQRGAGMGIGTTQGSAAPDPIPTGSAKTTSGGSGQGKKGKKGK